MEAASPPASPRGVRDAPATPVRGDGDGDAAPDAAATQHNALHATSPVTEERNVSASASPAEADAAARNDSQYWTSVASLTSLGVRGLPPPQDAAAALEALARARAEQEVAQIQALLQERSSARAKLQASERERAALRLHVEALQGQLADTERAADEAVACAAEADARAAALRGAEARAAAAEARAAAADAALATFHAQRSEATRSPQRQVDFAPASAEDNDDNNLLACVGDEETQQLLPPPAAALPAPRFALPLSPMSPAPLPARRVRSSAPPSQRPSAPRDAWAAAALTPASPTPLRRAGCGVLTQLLLAIASLMLWRVVVTTVRLRNQHSDTAAAAAPSPHLAIAEVDVLGARDAAAAAARAALDGVASAAALSSSDEAACVAAGAPPDACAALASAGWWRLRAAAEAAEARADAAVSACSESATAARQLSDVALEPPSMRAGGAPPQPPRAQQAASRARELALQWREQLARARAATPARPQPPPREPAKGKLRPPPHGRPAAALAARQRPAAPEL